MSKSSDKLSVESQAAKEIVVVLGMHRSGTSALTKGLQGIGVSLGEKLMPAGEFNPKGHWEDIDVVSINDKLLSHYGSVWFTATQPQIDLSDKYVQLLVQEAVSLVKRRTNEFNLWGFKDPRTSRLLIFWLEVFKCANVTPKFVYALRNPLDIARSLYKRDGINHRQGYLLWLWHTLPNLELLKSKSVCWVNYSTLISDPKIVIKKLQQQLSLDSVLDSEIEEYCASFIESSLSHSNAQLSDLYQDGQYFEPVLNLYTALEKISKYELDFDAWLDSNDYQEIYEDFDNAFTKQWSLLAEELNQDSFRSRELLYLSNSQLGKLKSDFVEKEHELVHINNQYIAHKEALNDLRAHVDLLNQEMVSKNNTLEAVQLLLDETERKLLESEGKLLESEGKLLESEGKLLESEGKLSEKSQKINDSEQQNHSLQKSIVELQSSIDAMRNSTSWKLTAPVRSLKPVLGTPVRTIKRCINFVNYQGGIKNTFKKSLFVYKHEGIKGIKNRISTKKYNSLDQYSQWLDKYGQLTVEQSLSIVENIKGLKHKPKISILMPVYNTPINYLQEAIESVRNQLYPHWELCIADDVSPNPEVCQLIRKYARKDSRIKLVERKENGHISEATNSALKIASGEFVALMDHDDVLPNDALYWVAEAIITNPDAALIFSDEDKITADGQTRYDPYFKSDWNPELFLSQNCLSHLSVYKTNIAKEIGGFRKGLEGSQDWDFALRFIEKIDSHQIIHIPRILYHWRAIEGSTAVNSEEKPYALIAGIQAVQEHCDRIGVKAHVCKHPDYNYVRVKYDLPENNPMVSIIIPTRNGLDVLSVCIDSILEKTTYKNYEIIIVDNGSDCSDTLTYLDSLQQQHKNIVVLRDDGPFNYSALNNKAVKKAKGDLIALVNNDIEVITPDWLTEMASYAIQPQNGAVGSRLWYPDDTLQHGGVIMVCGVAGHAHKHLPKGQPGYATRALLSQNFSAVTAACLVVRKDVFEQVGGLNEKDLTVAFNDVDFCLKVQEAGYLNVWTPYAELYHYESKTRGFEDTPEKKDRFSKEIKYMRNRWSHILDADPYYNPNLTMNHEDFSLAEERRL
ncbi:glycosyltransferase [Photobacterium leiognathi]|uniref:glycosyltransferase n=1 Tax=Photobacterium leiognathi TaxID=553611 RepID=UPI002981104E|nr:glycosyltransferase [Photobacterium leiognathi]